MVSKKAGIAVGYGLFVIVLISASILFRSNAKVPDGPVVSGNDIIEIEEDFELDDYGFDRLKANVIEGRVKRNESLYLILRDLDVSPQQIYQINQISSDVFQSNRIRPGQRYLAYTDKNSGEAQRLILHQNALDYVVIDWKEGIEISAGNKELTTQVKEASGVITSSLYEALVDKGDNWLLANRLSDVFAWQVDFFRLYPGDSYKVVYEEQFVEGESFGIGKVLAAEFTNDGHTFDAFYYENGEHSGYFDSEGNSIQKALLKAPFKFSQRISSGYSPNRFHPVLKRRMPHYGVDYAAPLGTPVLSVGDGEIIEAQYRGANGNIVKVRHNGTYTTAYLHLNGFAKGMRPGVRVKQGDVIGYVGRTGRVTGVHLDYRIYKNGQPVNPLKVDLPPSKSIGDEQKVDYEKFIRSYQEKLRSMEEEEDPIASAQN
ncbi:peptidoglycan DD-metalloendopeptidase family protein [Gracilimonas mengyeensis]|uniref:Murein DD-endopeptidase MepM and murein hydrolase activator NlpD, contain LysM domain n=1 Tax=Gracilimonas mengyeensis TaxID=1302730 RepID=A0A521FJH5_9BACT|nr:peptidoglycan DD-metalloendopeptidase family protein [Gracilimonas mengyeensis]SMO96276.1 Murein DD-endopeptidase MepM and murein hydrolase activator NlpD, contain LysM domain [Gracilimonas mengyeensis]